MSPMAVSMVAVPMAMPVAVTVAMLPTLPTMHFVAGHCSILLTPPSPCNPARILIRQFDNPTYRMR